MKRLIPLILIWALLLSGCAGMLDGSFHSVTPHEEKNSQKEEQIVSVSNYSGLYKTLCAMVENGTQSGIISVADYNQERVEPDMSRAIQQAMTRDPITSYAVTEITFELGTNAGQSAVAVNITYLHDRAEIQKIQHLDSMAEMETATGMALNSCESGLVIYVKDFESMDFAQWVKNYAASNPDKVMEEPEVTANVYPETGAERVVELKFTYQNSRDDLRNMQFQVQPLFNAAVIYAGGDGDEMDRFFKLYSFLMGMSPAFQMETSITPAYSLLEHGVGDSRAFATVYSAMCRQAGLECITVTGTRSGEPWYWNVICGDGVYYHIDLLQCHQADLFAGKFDADMGGYVWDYSAYPVCEAPPVEEPTEDPTEEPTEEPTEQTEAAA